MKKVLFVATVVKTHIMEFHVPYLKMLKELGWETSVAARNDYENPADCSTLFAIIISIFLLKDHRSVLRTGMH
jgi:hypothetical protein